MSDKFRAVFNGALGCDGAAYKSDIVGSYDLAKTILDSIAKYTLTLHERDLMGDHSNYGWVEQQVDGGWVDLDDDDKEGEGKHYIFKTSEECESSTIEFNAGDTIEITSPGFENPICAYVVQKIPNQEGEE